MIINWVLWVRGVWGNRRHLTRTPLSHGRAETMAGPLCTQYDYDPGGPSFVIGSLEVHGVTDMDEAHVHVSACEKEVRLNIDTGARCNLLPYNIYRDI
jgi:hypothetical protein